MSLVKVVFWRYFLLIIIIIIIIIIKMIYIYIAVFPPALYG